MSPRTPINFDLSEDSTAVSANPLWLMWRWFRGYFVSFYALMNEYRAELLLWAIATGLPLIMMGIWVEAGESGKFENFSAADAARYFIAVFIIRQITIVWVIYEFEWMVVSGRLSNLLMHPVDPTWRFILMHVSEQAARIPLVIPLVGLCLWLQPEAIWGVDDAGEATVWLPSATNVLMACVAVVMAFLMRFYLQYTIAILAFWFERVNAIESINMIPYTFLSGLVIPLHTLDPAVMDVIKWTPFPHMLWFPAQLLSGGEVDAVFSFAVLGGWLVLFYVINRIVWHRGLKHYSAMGA